MLRTASGPLAAIVAAISSRLGERAAVGGHVTDEADLVGPLPADRLTGDEHLHGDRVGDLAR